MGIEDTLSAFKTNQVGLLSDKYPSILSMNLYSKLSLTYRCNVNHYQSVLSACGNKKYCGSFQNKSVSFSSNECPIILPSGPKIRRREDLQFEGARRGDTV